MSDAGLGALDRALPGEPGARLYIWQRRARNLRPRRHGGATLFQNVRIFDGKSAALSAPSNVLVKGNTIERISVTPITVERMPTSASSRRTGAC